MENTYSKYLHAKIRAILTLFHLSFFVCHLAYGVHGNSPYSYNATENILLACGSSYSFPSADQTRTWFGDNSSQYFPLFETQYNASIASAAPKNPSSSPEKCYLQARLSHSPFTYIFNLTAGQKFIRLYFYPTSYPEFENSKAFFSVKAGSFTLLSNFSASLTAAAIDQDTFFKELCFNVEEGEKLNITFTPSPDYQQAYAFVNGIEIVSMPTNLYYTEAPSKALKFLDRPTDLTYRYSIENSAALETVYRVNIGGRLISPHLDTGMFRTWFGSSADYLTYARPGYNSSMPLNFSRMANYTAPAEVYQSAMTMGLDQEINANYILTWEFAVDSGFTYFVRLHFCEFQIEITKVGDRVFQVDIANETAENQLDMIALGNGRGVPIYKDYAVIIGGKGNEKKQNLSVALHPTAKWMSTYSDATLNGVEIFKVDNHGNLAGPKPDPIPPSAVPQTNTESKKSKNDSTTITHVAGAAAGFAVLSLLFLFIFRRVRKFKDSGSSTGASLWALFSSSTINSTKLRGSSLPSNLCTHFSLSDIKAATNNFDDVFIIGVGGFGNVYKGYVNDGSTPVAIKLLNLGSQQGANEFNTEIEMLSQLRHLHLVSLIGYCNDHGEMILVYDYMSRATLRDHLYNSKNPPLTWNQRLQICIGVARGLHYLNTGVKHVIIHRDVKTTNILLDEKWVAKLSDFGLSKMRHTTMSISHISTRVKGSFGYLDPEYFRRQQLTEKSDVYSFGVVLFEVLCGRPPILRTGDKKQASLAAWAKECYLNGTVDQIVDVSLKGKITLQCLKKFVEVAISCLHDDGIRRPSMNDVVWGLEFASQLQETADKDDKIDEAHHIQPHRYEDETPLRLTPMSIEFTDKENIEHRCATTSFAPSIPSSNEFVPPLNFFSLIFL
ncbi:LOW QUALITY PROTEIN: receptor-like protein kinase FERONIA [Pistacia vera]|uniref:LOW QUALITY PROTEIN: receptor-like protein kinase FERONIA n=1 Tax=Pistacia vera TaxID=55513 RepID=UPI001263CB69|nr:LOW QUALITY PROTEIN: receptor-like protein kinase FERONIA [Pistacia vera]